MSKKKMTLDDLKNFGNAYGGIGTVTEPAGAKKEDSEGSASGKHGIESSGTKNETYITAPVGDPKVIKK